MFPRVTHQCATLIAKCKHFANPVQLACVKPAASVRSEPGSNSHVIYEFSSCLLLKVLIGSLRYIDNIYFTYILPAYPLFFFTISYNQPPQELTATTSQVFVTCSSLPVSGLIWYSFSLVNNFFPFFSYFLPLFYYCILKSLFLLIVFMFTVLTLRHNWLFFSCIGLQNLLYCYYKKNKKDLFL